MHRVLTLLGYALTPFVMAIVPLVGFPAISSAFGVEGWLTFAVAQAIGGFALTAVELGWAWNGPMRVARVSVRNIKRYVALVVTVRALVFVPLAVLAGVASYVAVSTYQLDAAVIAVATASQGFSFAWLYIGRGRPWQVITREVCPRAILTISGAIGLYAGMPLWTYAIFGFILPALISVTLAIRAFKVTAIDFRGLTFPRLFLVLRSQATVMGARLISAGYMLLPTVLINATTTTLVAATFASGDRVLRLALSGLSVVPNMFQRWIGGQSSTTARVARARRAVAGNVVVGLFGGALIWLTAPLAVSILLSSTVKITYTESALLGVIVALTCASRATGGLWAVALGRNSVLLASTIAGVAVGVLSVWLLSGPFGALGGFVGVALAEAAVLITQVLALSSRKTRRPNL